MDILHAIRGIVIAGARRGRKLGYPTANVQLSEKIPEGIYASEVVIEIQTYQAATFVGSPKTYGEEDYKLEAYILDFDHDIYGTEIVVKLYKKIRENKKFESVEGLVEQINKDVENVRLFFRK